MVKMLVIETTGSPLSVACFEGGRPVACVYSDVKRNHSVSLMPFIERALETAGADIADIDVIACSRGPGSFTGVRIGAAAAKGLAQALAKPLIPVPTLQALAYNVFDESALIVPIMDARRGEVYACAYSWRDGLPRAQTEAMALPVTNLYNIIFDIISEKYGSIPANRVIFLGDGVNVHKEDVLRRGYAVAPSHLLLQNAMSAGALAAKLYEQGVSVSYADFQPFYNRKPQAERELDEKMTPRD